MQERRLTPPGRLDLRSTLGPLVRGRGDPTHRFKGGSFWRATRTPDGPATLQIERDGTEVVARAWGEGSAWALDRAPDLLGFRDDPELFEPKHDIVADMHRRLGGMRSCRTDAVIEALIPSILEQKVTGAEAIWSYHALVRAHGGPAPGPAGLMLQPSPDVIAGLPYWAFHPLGVERKRADTLRRVCSHADRMEEATSMDHAAAAARLEAIPGVGPWTAAEVGAVAFGDPDAVSVGDFHLKNVVAWVLAGEPRATDERMLALLEPYRGRRQRAVRLIEATEIGAPRFGPKKQRRSIARR